MEAASSAVVLGVSRSGDAVVFSLLQGDGSPASVLLLSVSAEDATRPLWQLAPLEATREVRLSVEIENVATAEQWEEAQLHLAGASTEFGVALDRVTYGVVPAGFQQILPEGAAPESLAPGRRYCVTVVAQAVAAVAFTA